MKRKTNLYVLINGEPKPCYDFLVWRKFMDSREARVIAHNRCEDALGSGEVNILTYFLGMDHGYNMHPKPILFETVVQGGFQDGTRERYFTKDEALAGHDVWHRRALESMGYISQGDYNAKMGKSHTGDNVTPINGRVAQMRQDDARSARSTEPGRV